MRQAAEPMPFNMDAPIGQPNSMTGRDYRGLLWLVERAAIGCLDVGETRWAAQLRLEAKRLRSTLPPEIGAALVERT